MYAVRTIALSAALFAFTSPEAHADTGRRCLFLHGVGQKGPGVYATRVDALGATVPYWGNLEAELKGVCGTVEYANVDTSSTPWDNLALQKDFYGRAKEVYASGGVVFAHGTANLVLGGACAQQGLCDARWYGLGGPIRGSKAASESALPFVPTMPASAAPSWPGLTPGPKGGSVSEVIATKGLLKGAVCGTSAWGSGGVSGAALLVAQARVYGIVEVTRTPGSRAVVTQVLADGLVGLDECAQFSVAGAGGAVATKPLATFGLTPDSAFYLMSGNHWDLTGGGGNHGGIYDWIRGRVLAK
jgi:hypothetical protein